MSQWHAGSIVNAFPSHKSSCLTSWQTTSRSDNAAARMKRRISDPGWSFILASGADGAASVVFLWTDLQMFENFYGYSGFVMAQRVEEEEVLRFYFGCRIYRSSIWLPVRHWV